MLASRVPPVNGWPLDRQLKRSVFRHVGTSGLRAGVHHAHRPDHRGDSTRLLLIDSAYQVDLPVGSPERFQTALSSGRLHAVQSTGGPIARRRSTGARSIHRGAGRAILSWRSRDTTSGLTCRCTGRHRGARARAPRARVYAGLARAAGERRLVSEPTNSKSLKAMGSGDSTRRCASDRLVAVGSVISFGGVGVAVSGTHGGAVARPQPGDRGARHASARLDRSADPAAVGSGRAGGGLGWAVPRAKEPEHPRMTSANIPLEPTRPASDSCAGLTAQR